MTEYHVSYDIEVDAESALDAALQVERILNEYPSGLRPALVVQEVGPDTEPVLIDLDDLLAPLCPGTSSGEHALNSSGQCVRCNYNEED